MTDYGQPINDLLVVMVLAPARELEAAWQEAQPILDSVQLDRV
jgi:hypothetical protein